MSLFPSFILDFFVPWMRRWATCIAYYCSNLGRIMDVCQPLSSLSQTIMAHWVNLGNFIFHEFAYAWLGIYSSNTLFTYRLCSNNKVYLATLSCWVNLFLKLFHNNYNWHFTDEHNWIQMSHESSIAALNNILWRQNFWCIIDQSNQLRIQKAKASTQNKQVYICRGA